MWIFYYCTYGPGHQSSSSEFKYFSDDWRMDDIKEHLMDQFHDQDTVMLRFWEVERPPVKNVDAEIKVTERKIKKSRKYLKVLKEESCFCPEEKQEEDKVLQRNLKGRIVDDLLMRLHKAGFMYSYHDINNWHYGKTCLTEPKRSKILNIIRRTKSY